MCTVLINVGHGFFFFFGGGGGFGSSLPLGVVNILGTFNEVITIITTTATTTITKLMLFAQSLHRPVIKLNVLKMFQQ